MPEQRAVPGGRRDRPGLRIACPIAQTCYLAASGGSIARITNGTTLAAQRTPTSRDLYGVSCVGPATCYAVGDKGTLLALG